MDNEINCYDFCLAWNWEYDTDFIRFINTACEAHGLSLLQVTQKNIGDVLPCIIDNRITFKTFFDRASDSDKKFLPIIQWVQENGIYRINPREKAVLTWNKSKMHFALVKSGLNTPYTIILPSYEEEPVLSNIDLSQLGKNFIIKPAHGGGGEGVLYASSLSQVLIARQQHPSDIYLLQAHIHPTQLNSRLAWFRIIYCAGETFLCWWDIITHVYTHVTQAEENFFSLTPLRNITMMIANICGLDLFSTEIALSSAGHFIVIDYVNDQIDLRIKSKTYDGVPDDIVHYIVQNIITLIKNHCINR